MAATIGIQISADIGAARKALDALEKNLAQVSAKGERFAASVQRSAAGTEIKKLASDVGEVGRRIGAAVEGLGRFAPALATITGAASIAGLAKLVEVWTGFGSRLGFDAQRIGMSARSLHGLQGAARLAGSSAEALTDGMRTLGDNLVDAVGGRSPETVVMLANLGIGFRDAATGGARLAEDVLPEIANKIASIRNPALQARVATTLLGGAGEALLPFLRRGAVGIAEYNDAAIRYGVVNQAGVTAANAMREAQARLGLAVEGVAYTVAERLAPVLVPMLLRLSDWVSAHREDIGRFFEGIAISIGKWADDGGPQKLLDQLKAIGDKIGEVVDFMGGWQNAALLVGAAMLAGPVASVVLLTARLTSLFALRPAAWLLRMLGLGAATTALALPLALSGDTPGGPTPNAITPDEARRQADETNARVEAQGGLWGALRRMFGGGMNTGAGRAGVTPSEGRVPGLPQGEQDRRARTAFDAFVGMGDTPAAAAARVANIQVESGYNERAVGDGGQAYGLGQHHPDRQAQFAARFGHDMRQGTFDEQLRFHHDDPDPQSQKASRLIRDNPGMSAYDAAGLITRLQERPGDGAGESYRRGVLAESILRRYGTQTATPPPLAAPVAAPPAPQGGQAGANGRVGVTIDMQGQPPGTRLTTTTEGNVTVRAPRIDLAMPGWSAP